MKLLNVWHMNRLFFGDNLKWLRDPKEFLDESVDLVYLDPPFNSNVDYNVLFRSVFESDMIVLIQNIRILPPTAGRFLR